MDTHIADNLGYAMQGDMVCLDAVVEADLS